MKNVSLLLLFLFCVVFTTAQNKPFIEKNSHRIEKIINSQWTFNYFSSEVLDKGYELAGFNDSRWPAVSLPHTWNTYEITGELTLMGIAKCINFDSKFDFDDNNLTITSDSIIINRTNWGITSMSKEDAKSNESFIVPNNIGIIVHLVAKR